MMKSAIGKSILNSISDLLYHIFQGIVKCILDKNTGGFHKETACIVVFPGGMPVLRLFRPVALACAALLLTSSASALTAVRSNQNIYVYNTKPICPPMKSAAITMSARVISPVRPAARWNMTQRPHPSRCVRAKATTLPPRAARLRPQPGPMPGPPCKLSTSTANRPTSRDTASPATTILSCAISAVPLAGRSSTTARKSVWSSTQSARTLKNRATPSSICITPLPRTRTRLPLTPTCTPPLEAALQHPRHARPGL